MRVKGKKKLILTTLLIYCGALLLQDFSIFFQSKALEQKVSHSSIVAILVDDTIYKNIQDDLERYTTSYIQQEIPDSKALVMPLNLKNIDAPNIYKMLENIYFDGLEGENSTLLGVILVGNIPLPVVNQDGYVFPSIYPYVDFLEQKFVRNPIEGYFTPNGNINGQADIWHGLIDYGSDITAYHQFFAKVKKYITNPKAFIGPDVRYEDVLANQQGFLSDNLQYYQNKLLFSEDIGYQRFTPLMLNLFQAGQTESMSEITNDLFASFDELGGSGMSDTITYTGADGKPVSTSVSNALKSTTEKGISTKAIEKSIKTSFLLDYPSLYSVQNSVTLRDNVLAGGRWVDIYTDADKQANLKAKADSSIDKINLKDTVNIGNDALKGVLISFNDRLEKAVDDKIVKERYDMDIVIPTTYEHRENSKISKGVRPLKRTAENNFTTSYEIFYFGKSANLINNAQELSIYRGSFRNLSSLTGINYTTNGINYATLASDENPSKTPQESTNLQLKSVGASYDLFSTQVEANRGYNLQNTQTEYDSYEENKTYAKRGTECKKRTINIRGWKRFCRQMEHKADENGGYETLSDFAQRRRGGASPLNLDFDLLTNLGTYMLKSFTGKQARAEIFDIGGSKALTGRQSTANSYKAYSTYASPTAKTTKAGEKNNSYTQNERLPIIQMPFNEVDFFKIWNNGKDGKVNNQPRSTKFTPTTFQIYRERGGKNRMTSKTHSYKIISSIIKNTSILPEQLNGMQTTKFGTGSKLTNYYQTLTEKLTTTLANFTTSSTKVTEMGTIIEAELSGLTTNLSDIENKIQTINGVQENISTLTNQINTLTYHINRLTDEINTLIEEINSGTLDDATLTDKQNELANKQNERTNNQNERSNKQNQRSNAQTNATSIGQQLNQTIINTTNNIKATITALKPIPDQTTEDEITEIEQIPNNFEELYNIVNNLNIDEVMETLTTIEMFEQETLKDANQQIEFASGRIKEIKIHLDQIHTTYKSIVTKYNTTYTKINNTLTRLSTQLSNTTNSQKYNQARLSGYIQTSTHTDFQKLIGTKTDTLTLTTDSSIPIDFATFFNILFIESGLQKATANDFDHINISEEVRTKFERMFTGLNQDEQLTIPGLNIITPDRPIDSPRYTTFQGINAQEVKFIYPNLYKVEVYKSGSGGTQLLKTIPEIKAALETYLKNKVNEYNTILNTITPTATTNAYTKLQSLGFTGATPIGRSYTSDNRQHLFKYEELLTALGGTSQLNIIAELLYYQNLTNAEKSGTTGVLADLNATKDSFDINKKTKYVLSEYLTENNPKLQRQNSGLVIPTYKPLGYELAYINSNGDDYVQTSFTPSFFSDAQTQSDNFDSDNAGKGKKDGEDTPSEEEQAFEENCNIPIDGSVLLFDIQEGNSPRFKAFQCRLKEVKKTPMKLELTRTESLGPVLPFSEERTNTLENEITKPLAERADAMQDYGNQWEDSRKEAVSTSDQAESNLINLETQAELANKTRISSGSHTKELSQYYAKVKTYINANTINEKTSNLKLELTSATELGSIEVIITSTGASCLQVNGKNLCNGAKRTKRFNPKTTPQQLDVTSADKKAGVSLLQIQMCIPGTTDCVTKNQRITIQPGPRDHFNIQPQSTFTPRGMVTPITITARDANNNPIDRTNDQFTIQVNEGLFLHDGSYKSSFTADRFKNLTVLYQAPQTGTATTATIEILSSPKLTPNGVSTGTLQLKATQQIIDATPLVKLNGTNIITTLGGSGNKTIQLNNTGNNTPQKIELFIRNSQGQNINIDTSVSIKTNNGLLNIGTLEGKKFKKRSTHTLSEGQLTFYYYPTNTAGKELLTIQIPGLAPLTINFDIKPAIAQVVEMQINQENLNISTTTTGTIQIKDVRGNLVPTSTAVKFTSTQNLTTTPNNNVIVSSGQMTFTTTAKEAGVGYLIGEIITNAKTQTKPGTIRVHITDNLIPTTGLNILYLNYFGNDRGNQRGYFSDNNKYIETMMKNSNKLLATTTQLVDESKIKKLLRAVDSNFQIKTYEGIATTLNLSGNQIHLNMGNIGSLTTTLDPITRITISETEEYQKITESKKIGTNFAFFFPNNDDISPALPAAFTATLSQYSLSDGTLLRETPQGSIALRLPKHTLTNQHFTTTQPHYQVQQTFSNGSTNNKSTRGIFNTQNQLDLPAGYLSIQDSTTSSNYVGFRGEFKNMTLFAQGERVGEASKKFGSELLINLGDPLLKKYDTNLEVYNTDFDGGLGTEVFSDPDKTIFTTKPIDFNNDELQDLIVVYTDGTVKLSKNYGYGTGANFKNLENLMLIAVGIQEVDVGDVDGNGYPDIMVQTTNNQLRVYTNNFGKFDVDGNPVCLNTNVNEGKISETPINTSGIYQIFLEDMDKDGSLDIVTNDKKGFVKIFYGGKNGQNTYVSTNKATCDTGRYNRQAANTTIITRFGINLTNDEIVDNSMAHRYGLNERYMANSGLNIEPADLEEMGVEVPDMSAIEDLLNGMTDEQLKDFDPSLLYKMARMETADPNAMATAGIDAALKYQEITTDSLTSGKKTNVFIPISHLDTTASKDPDNVEIYKIYKDLNGDILENGDLVDIEVHFKAGKKGFVGAFGDKIQGPRKVSLNNNGIPKSLADNLQLYTTNPYRLILHEGDANFSYLMDNIRINPNQTRSYTYQVVYSDTQTQLIDLEDIDGTKYGTGYEEIKLGGDVDIKLQPTDGCIKFMKAFLNQPNDAHRKYTTKDINLREIIVNYTETIKETQSGATNDFYSSLNNQDINNLIGLENNAINPKDMLGSLVSQALNGGVNLDIEVFNKQLDQVQQELEKVAEGLCKGFSFGGTNTCKGLPIPFNRALFAPGDYHILGCIKLPIPPLDKGLPIFHFPGTLTTPVGPIPIPRGMKGPGDGFIRIPGGTYPSMVRIYAAPTTTMQLGVAVCLGPYAVGTALKTPFAELGGNCIVTAINFPCGSSKTQSELDNPGETVETRIDELGNTCEKTRKGTINVEKGRASSPFEMVQSTCQGRTIGGTCINPNSNDSYAPYIPSGQGLFGIIDLEMDSESVAYGASSTPESSLTIGNVKIEGGSQTKNRIKSGFQRGIRELIIDKRLDPQIRYIANNFTKMNISLKRPDFKAIGDDINTLTSIFSEMKTDDTPRTDPENPTSQLQQRTQSLNDQIANPFEQLATLFNQTNLINIQMKKMTVKIPMIYNEDINTYEDILRQRASYNAEIIEQRAIRVDSLLGTCFSDKTSTIADRFQQLSTIDEHNPNNSGKIAQINAELKKELKNGKCSTASDTKTQELIQQTFKSLFKFINDYERMLDQINANILTLQEYRNFPFELYERVHAIDRYMAEISAIVNNLFGYLSFWMTTNANRFSSYVDAIILIMNVFKTYQILPEFSKNRSQRCGTCTNDTYDQNNCKLAILCKFFNVQLPIIQIPNFKIPNITLDFSDLNVGLDLLLPTFNFQPAKIDLPNIPNLPTPPNLQIDLNIFSKLGNLNLSLPSIPELPSPPHLPELPSFLPNIKLQLPILPPAPKLPEIPHKFEATIKLVEKIGRIICIVKQGLGLVGESSVKAKIEQLTQRTYEVPYVDRILDLTNIQASKPKLNGFDFDISAQANMQFSFGTIYDFLDSLTTTINNMSTTITHSISDGLNTTAETSQALVDIVQACIDNPNPEQCKTNAKQGRDTTTNTWKQGRDTTTNTRKQGRNTTSNSPEEGDIQQGTDIIKSLVSQTSEEINYVDYPQAKQRLENVLATLTTQISSDHTTLQQITTISNTINTPSDIQPNQQAVNNIQNEITNLINQEQTKLLAFNDFDTTSTESYDRFLAMIEKNETATEAKENTSTNSLNNNDHLAFHFNLFTIDPTTEKLLTDTENPYKILLENKAPIIDAFLETLEGNTPSDLQMTPTEYQIQKNNLTTLKTQLAGFYQTIQPNQQTKLLTKNEDSSSTKQLIVQTNPTASAGSNSATQIDPAAYVNGIFAKTKDGKKLTKVVYSESNATKIGKQYYTTDLNKDKVEDMILRDSHNVYIKYGNQNESFSRQTLKNTKFYTASINNIPNEATRLTFDNATKLKISDTHEEVKNFAIKGQTFDSISISRRQSRESDVDGYLLKLTDRIDYSPEKEDLKKNLIETYILVLPKGTDITGMKLTFPTQKLTRLITDEVQNRATPELKEATKNKLIGEIKYFDPNQSTIITTLENIERKRDYTRIATLKLASSTNSLTINSPRSNQLVAGRQIIGDDQGPEGTATLYRPTTQEIVNEGDALEGVIGTHYNLVINRADNVLLTNMDIKYKGQTLTTTELQAQTGTIAIENLFFTGATSQQYQISATDHFGNTTTKAITLTISIPDITITNVEKTTDTQAVITAELSQDIDEGTATFQKNRNSYRANLIAKPNQTENYELKPKQTEIKGDYYDLNNNIALYSKSDEIIAEIDPNTGEITIKDERKNNISLKVSTAGSTLIIQVYNTAGALLFNITLPPQELINIIAPAYTITNIDNEYFGRYNGGKAVHRNGENILLIAPDGQLYTEKNLIGTYKYNPSDQTISYIVKEGALATQTIEIVIKVSPFNKQQT